MPDFDSSLPIRSEADIHSRVQTKIVDYTTPTQGLEVDALGKIGVKVNDSAGNALSPSNPLPVQNFSLSTKYNDYATTAAVAADATADHDFTAPAALRLLAVHASGSGKIKAEVKIETGVGSGIYNSYFVEFNSTGSPNIQIPMRAPILVATGVKVRVTLTNRDNQAQDLYSTICAEAQ